MKTLTTATLIAFAISFLVSSASAYSDSSSHRRVLQSSIKTLTFYDGELTQGRRTQPVPQLSCVGKACKQYRPDVVQCTSMGDGEWKVSRANERTMKKNNTLVEERAGCISSVLSILGWRNQWREAMYLEAMLLPKSLFASETKLSKEHHSDSTPSPPLSSVLCRSTSLH